MTEKQLRKVKDIFGEWAVRQAIIQFGLIRGIAYLYQSGFASLDT